MRKTLLTFYGLACMACLHAQEVTRTAEGAKNFIRTQDVTEEIRFYSDAIVRVIKYPARQMPDKKSYPVIKTPENIDISYTEQGGNLSMKTQNLEVIMDKNSGKITFKDLQGNLLIQEKEFGTNFANRSSNISTTS